MGRERPLGSEPYQQHPTCHQPIDEWMRSVPLDILGTNGVKWFVRAPPFCKRIPSSGWEPSAILAMGIIEVISCVQQLSLPDTSPANTSLCIGLSSDWMANMAIMLW